MAYSDSFPATRPVFQADFANGGRVDPRISYSRSTTGTYFGTDKHLSSENLFTHSASSYLWATYNGASKADGAANGPDGSTNTAYSITFNNTSQYVNTGSVGLDTSASYTFSFYAKVASGTQTIIIGNIATGVFSNVTVTTDWQRFTVTQTPTATTRYPYIGPDGATGLGTLLIWGAQLEKRGSATALNETSGQIHREYAPTLQTAAINAPRFEFSASDSASAAMGESLGLLVEGQAQNLIAYSDDFANQWNYNRVNFAESAAVSPTGELNADLIYADGTAGNTHLVQLPSTVTAAAHTFSVYAKSAGCQYIRLTNITTGSGYGHFDLINGTVTSSTATSTIESVGNGWYRCSITETQTAGTHYGRVSLAISSGSIYWDGDNYSGVLLWGAQNELGSHASSPIATNGSAVTRASDSASAVTADIGYTGGPVSIVAEGDSSSDYGVLALLRDSSGGGDVAYLYANPNSTNKSEVYAGGVTSTATATAGTGTSALALDTNRLAACRAGGAVTTDTSTALPVLNQLQIGSLNGSYVFLNGHVKRIALYGEALSDSNLQSLTK